MTKLLLRCGALILLLLHLGNSFSLQRINKASIAETPQLRTNIRHQMQPATIIAQGASSQTAAINKAAMKAVAKLLSTCGIGVWASQAGLLNSAALGVLSKLIFSLFQPCLLFVNVCTTVAKLGEAGSSAALYMLPLAGIFQITLGYFIGKIISFFVYGRKAESEESKQLLACATFSNSGPLPLVFSDALFRGNADPTLLTRSVAYISLYLLGWSPFFWVVAPGILEERKEGEDKKSFITNIKSAVPRMVSPPVVASILGMIFGFLKPVNQYFLPSSSVLNPVFEAMRTLSTGYLPCVLLVLAGSLSGSSGPKPEEGVGKWPPGKSLTNEVKEKNVVEKILAKANENSAFALQILMIYMVKFLLLPVTGFTLLTTVQKFFPAVATIFRNDPLLLFILLLETCMPSAQNTTVILNLQGKKSAAGRLARTLLAVYILGVPAISFWLVKILKLTALTA